MYVISIPNEEIRHKYICVIDALYETMHAWIVEHGWEALYGAGQEGDIETMFYLNEENHPLYNYNVWWRLKKDINSQVRYIMNIDMIGIAIKKVEVVWKGKKYSAQNGEFTFHINGRVEIDYKNKWEKSRLMKTFMGYITRRLMKNDYENYKEDLRKEIERFKAFMKTFFGLYQNIVAPENLDPLLGYGFK